MVSVGLSRADEIRACADRVAVCMAGAPLKTPPAFWPCPIPPQCMVPEGPAIVVKVLPPSETFWDQGEEFWSVKGHENKPYFSLLMEATFFLKALFGAALLIQIIWGYTNSYCKRNPGFSVCHHTPPRFSVWRKPPDSWQCHKPARTLEVTLSILALLKEFHSMEIAWRLQTENSFKLSDPSPPV